LAAPASIKKLVLLAALAVFSPPAAADVFNREDVILDPHPERFSVCYNGSCQELAVTGVDLLQWQQVKAPFSPPALDPETERRQIARAVALMERFVGPLTDTSHDLEKNDAGVAGENWMDCIDESTNTTSYLKMFAANRLLRWHTVEDRQTRGWFLFGYPHTSAVIRDTQSGRLYAVDSWFYRNGEPPVVLPVEVWRNGWQPPEK
jgi:hypothetical protein